MPFLERRVVVQKESSETLGIDEVEREVMVREPVKKEQLVHLRIKQTMQITKQGLISRVRWIGVKHIKDVSVYISTPRDSSICMSFMRWLTS